MTLLLGRDYASGVLFIKAAVFYYTQSYRILNLNPVFCVMKLGKNSFSKYQCDAKKRRNQL
jgi:hypothetical protein